MTAGEWEGKHRLESLTYVHGFKQLLLQFRLGIKPTRDKEVVREKKRNEEKLLLVCL